MRRGCQGPCCCAQGGKQLCAKDESVRLLQHILLLLKVLLLVAVLLFAAVVVAVASSTGGVRGEGGRVECDCPPLQQMAPQVLAAAAVPLRAPCPMGGSAPSVLVVYASANGHTQALAEAVASGASTGRGGEDDNDSSEGDRGRSSSAVVRLRTAAEAKVSDVLWADAVVLGSPTFNAAVDPGLQAFINAWPLRDQRLRGKVGGGFVTSGGVAAGHELVLSSIHASLQIFGFILAPGPTWVTALGAYAVDAEATATLAGFNQSYFLEEGRRYGASVVHVAARLRG